MKKIVITGGIGYIGTELCKIYSGESWNNKITVIDNRFISERVNQLKNWNINFVIPTFSRINLAEFGANVSNTPCYNYFFHTFCI